MKFRIVEYETVDSTNDVAGRLADGGAKEGLVIRSDVQRHGRGRGRHRWHCPKRKGLLASFLLRPRDGAAKASRLTVLACRAIEMTLKSYLDEVEVKLPNDILMRGRKVGGVLVEGKAKGSSQEWACVGLGVNVLIGRSEIYKNGTSILIETGRKTYISHVLDSIIDNFNKIYT